MGMTTTLILAYGALGYWYFRATLAALQPYDTPTTAVLNAALALTIGPTLLATAIVFDCIHRIRNETMAGYNN